MANTDKAWRSWGRDDPYYGVLSIPEFRRDNLAANIGKFFASGDEYIGGRLKQAERIYGPFSRCSALDFGCGVGRLLIPLAQHFDRVTGVDISEAMLAECRANLFRFKVANGELALSDDGLSAVSGSFDFVHSYIVLQHIPVKRGTALIDRLLGATTRSGVASLQVTLDRMDGPAPTAVYWAQRYVPGIQFAVNLARGRSVSEPLVQMNEYSLPAILRLFAAHGFGSVTVDVEQQGRCLSVNLMAQRH